MGASSNPTRYTPSSSAEELIRLRARVQELERELAGSVQAEIEQHKAVDAFQVTAAYVQSIVDTVREPMLVLDDRLCVKTASRSFYETFQVPADETEGKCVYELGSGQWNIEKLRILLEVILRDNVSFSDFDVEHVFPSIGRRSMVLNARKIWREGNNSALILLAIQDVTKRKQAEAECEQLIRELRRSNEDLGQFAYVASHDLRSPLNTVLQFTQLLVRRHGEKLGREANDYLQIVQESVTRMEALITALLRYSHYSEADQNLVEPAAAAAACETAMANLQGVIEESGARITWDDLPEIRIDSTQLLQIFQNLIANAIHYRGDAVPEVHISTKLQDARWLFSVSDNGPGIAAKYHDRIFEPFKRLHGPERPGSGIGLALCRKIVERSGGRIWVDSEEGKGSTFRFSLPQA